MRIDREITAADRPPISLAIEKLGVFIMPVAKAIPPGKRVEFLWVMELNVHVKVVRSSTLSKTFPLPSKQAR